MATPTTTSRAASTISCAVGPTAWSNVNQTDQLESFKDHMTQYNHWRIRDTFCRSILEVETSDVDDNLPLRFTVTLLNFSYKSMPTTEQDRRGFQLPKFGFTLSRRAAQDFAKTLVPVLSGVASSHDEEYFNTTEWDRAACQAIDHTLKELLNLPSGAWLHLKEELEENVEELPPGWTDTSTYVYTTSGGTKLTVKYQCLDTERKANGPSASSSASVTSSSTAPIPTGSGRGKVVIESSCQLAFLGKKK